MTRPGHPDLASAYADHARRRMTGDLVRLRDWPGWGVRGETAQIGECPLCMSSLVVTTRVMMAGEHDGYELGEAGA